MLRYLRYELKKLLLNKAFWLLIVITLFALLASAMFQVSQSDYKNTVTQAEYNNYLDGIQNAAEQQGSVSIFENDKNSFSSRNIEKTAEDLAALKNVVIKADKSGGVELLTSLGIADLISVVFVIFLSYFVFFYEKERKLYQIIKCTPNGNRKTFFAKLGVVLLFCVVFHLASFVLYSLASIKLGGFGELTRSIQSVTSFMKCDIKCNVLSMLVIYYILRVIGLFATSVVFSFVALKVNNSVIYTFLSVLISTISYLLTFIKPQSFFSFFKYVNFANVVNPLLYLSQYRNINILGYPISFRIIMLLLIIISVSMFVLIGMITYIKSELTARKIKIKNPFSFNIISGKIKSIFFFELYKTSVINKGLILLLVFLIFEGVMIANTNYYKSPEEYYYQNYMEILSGEITQDKIDYIESEKLNITESERFEKELNEKYAGGEITLIQFQNELKKNTVSQSRKNAFNRLVEQYERISKNKNPCFIYETGYKRLFNIGKENRMFGMFDLAVLLIIVVLCAAPQIPLERKSKMDIILNTTPNGIRRTIKNKFRVSILYSTLLVAIKYAAEIIIIKRNYGFEGLSFPICNALDGKQAGLSVLGVIIIKFLVIYLLCVLIAIIATFIMKGKKK